MKAIILAGGYAKRFWPVTRDKPKPLLPIAGKPIIDLIMDKIEQVPEVNTVYLSTNEAFAEQFQQWAEQRKTEKRIELVVEPSKKESEKFGSLGALEYIIRRKKLKSDLLVLAGDNIFSFDLNKFIDSYRDEPRIIVHNMHDRQRCRRYGVVSLGKDMKITDFEEKPREPKSTLVSTACYVFPKDTLKLFKEYKSKDKPLDNMGSFLEWLYKRTTVRGYITEGFWYDIGDKHFYIQANKQAMQKKQNGSILLGKKQHSRINRSYVGKESFIKNSALKDCVVFGNVHIENCALRECIIDDHSRLVNVDLNDSLIGAYTKLNKRKIIKSRRFFLPPVTGQEILNPGD